jgi:hypothetical protein
LQVAGLTAAAWFLVHTALVNRAALAAVPFQFAAGPFAAASVLTIGTYVFLVWAWAGSLRWWGQSLALRDAVRIWFITNLTRFVPGIVWQFAHVGTEALAARISPVAATGAMVFQQLVLLATGVAVAGSLTPMLPGQGAGAIAPAMAITLASLGVMAVIILLPVVTPRLERWTSRLLGREIPWPAPTRGELSRYTAVLVLPWLAYGVAFWLFGRAVLGESAAPGLMPAAAAYIGSYVAGIIAVFAPGGLGIREAALVALLSPAIGAPAALFLAIAARLWLVGLELATALAVLLWQRRPGMNPEP